MRKSMLRGVLLAMYTVLGLLNEGLQADPWHSERGLASHYGKEFQGKKTASGERFSPNDMTAAHRKLPLGTKVTPHSLYKDPQSLISGGFSEIGSSTVNRGSHTTALSGIEALVSDAPVAWAGSSAAVAHETTGVPECSSPGR